MNDLKIDEGFSFHTYLVLHYYFPEAVSNTTLTKIRHVPGIITIVKLIDYSILKFIVFNIVRTILSDLVIILADNKQRIPYYFIAFSLLQKFFIN